MTDLATLVLAVDSTQVPKGTAALDNLTAAGQRAEASTEGVTTATRAAGAAAAQMAASAQSSAQAAVGFSSGMRSVGSATNAARVEMLEMTHIARNLTEQIAMGASPMRALAMESGRFLTAVQYGGAGVGGFIKQFGSMLGIIQTVKNAELAEQAANAEAAAGAIRGATARATANITAADTEIELALAAQRTATTSGEAAAASDRLAAGHAAATAAARELTIAEDALAVAQGRAAEAAKASAAATSTSVGVVGAVLGVVAAAAGLAFGAFKQFQSQVRDDGDLTRYRDSLGLTHREMLELTDGVDKAGGKIKELTDVTVTAGDVMSGLWKTIEEDATKGDGGKAWDGIKSAAVSAFNGILDAWAVVSAGITAGIYGTYNAVKTIWANFPATFGDLFVQGVNLAITALNGLVKKGVDLLNGFISGADSILDKVGGHIGNVSAPSIDLLSNPNAGAAAKTFQAIKSGYSDSYAFARKKDDEFWARVKANSKQSLKDRMKDEADAIIANRPDARGRHPRQPGDHGLGQEMAELDDQIKGQNALADAYLVSDAAAIKAAADEKALEQATRHHADAAALDVLKQKELALAIATASAEGAKHVADLRFEADTRQLVNGQVQAGLISANDMNDELQLETQLRPLTAAASLAEGAAKERLIKIIRDLTDAYHDNVAAIHDSQAIQDSHANDNEIAKLQLENSLIGASNKERATAIAQLEEMQRLGITALSTATSAQRDAVQSVGQRAADAVQTPWQQWASSVPGDAKSINDALQSIETRGFDTLASSIADVVTGTESLGKAFKDVASSIISDIIQMTVKMLIFRAVSSFMGGGSSIGGGDSGLFGGGASGLGDTYSVGGLATGGPVMAGQTYLVGEKGPELFKASTSGTIIPNDKLATFPSKAAVNSNSPQEVHVTIGFGEAPAFAPYVQQVAGAAAGQAVKLSVNHTNQTVKALVRPKLMGR